MNRPLLLVLAALALAACSPDFDPASHVEKLRVLAIRAEPPEIQPADASGPLVAPDRAALGALVVRADHAVDPTRKTTVFYLACLPVPGDPTPTLCVMLAGLRDPTAFLVEAAQASCAGGGAEPPPITFAGAEVCEGRSCGPAVVGGVTLPAPELALPAGYGPALDNLPGSAPERVLGVQAVVLGFALDAAPDELAPGSPGACPEADVAGRLAALWPAREHVLATKRVMVRGPEAPDLPNQNPAIDDVASGGAPLPATLVPGTWSLAPLLPPDAAERHQPYTKLDAEGIKIEDAREEWVTSWFATAGDLEDLHTRDGEEEPWTVFAPGGPATLAAVVRDRRGGVAWKVRDLTIAP
jgi:hypothetical protein